LKPSKLHSISEWFRKVDKHRNKILSVLAVASIVAVVLSIPYPPFPNLFTPQVEATYPILQEAKSNVENGTFKLGDGYVKLSGKGGISANNRLTAEVTLYFLTGESKHKYAFVPKAVTVDLEGAFESPIRKDNRGFPVFATIPLVKQDGIYKDITGATYDKWTQTKDVQWFRSGDFRARIRTWGETPNLYTDSVVDQKIYVGSEDVTTTSTVGALFITLTLVAIVFGLIELRRK